jgi:hypothetical protein
MGVGDTVVNARSFSLRLLVETLDQCPIVLGPVEKLLINDKVIQYKQTLFKLHFLHC